MIRAGFEPLTCCTRRGRLNRQTIGVVIKENPVVPRKRRGLGFHGQHCFAVVEEERAETVLITSKQSGPDRLRIGKGAEGRGWGRGGGGGVSKWSTYHFG